jgi:hypothetical protein
MTTLYLLGASSRAMPELKNLRKLKILMQYNNESALTYIEDGIILAKEQQDDNILSILRGYYRKYQLFNVIMLLDRYALGGILRKIYRKIKNSGRSKKRVELRGPQPFDI